MKKLTFQSIRVSKAPGFPDGLNATGLDQLSPGINLVTGPNGTGKSTMARILQKLIWQNQTEGFTVHGLFEMGGESWSSMVNSGYQSFQKGGNKENLAGLPAEETRDKYMLAMHELVNVGDDTIAGVIRKEAAGGYSVEQAGATLEYQAGIKGAKGNIVDDYRDAIKKVYEKTEEQAKLKTEEGTLVRLESEKEKAEQASKLLDFYSRYIQYQEANTDLEQKRAILAEFPKVLANAHGDELQRIETLENTVKTETELIKSAILSIQDSIEIIAGLPIPQGGIDQKVLTTLNGYIDHLALKDSSIETHQPEITKLQKEEKIARERIDNIKDLDNWTGISLDQIGDMDQFMLKAYQLLGNKISLENEKHRLAKQAPKIEKNTEVVRRGIQLLSDWLKEQKGQIGISPIPFILLALAGIGSAVAASLLGIVGLWSIALIILISGITLRFYQNRKNREILTVWAEQYLRTGLPVPANWETEEVTLSLDELTQEMNQISSATEENNRRLKRIEEIDSDLTSLAKSIDQIYTLRDHWLEQLGAVPDLPEDLQDNLTKLYVFLKHVLDWQSAWSTLKGMEARYESLRTQRELDLEKCNQILVELQQGIVTDSITARTLLNQLSAHEQTRTAATANIRNKEKEKGQCETRLANATRLIEEIYERLNIDHSNQYSVSEIISKLEDYRKAVQEEHTALTLFSNKEFELQNHLLYAENQELIDGLGLNEAIKKQNDYTEIAGGYTRIIEEITAIKTQVDIRKKSREMEEALGDKEKAIIKLENLYEQNLSSITGSILVNQLRNFTDTENQPQVLKRANELFSRITNQRYRLIVSNDTLPVFRAYDNVMQQGLDLKEISTGTRVQLLICVRLAYIELQEKDIKLPILADELLANSDDDRARAIIDALYEISKDGRQIFYFTAQPEEVAKWESVIGVDNELDFKVIALGGNPLDTNHDKRYIEDLAELNLLQTVPEPNGNSYNEYRLRLNIPYYNLITHQPNQLHIAYLIEDVQLIYKVLQKGIRQWGQLIDFYNYDGHIDGLDDKVFGSMQSKIQLLKDFQDLYKIGRSRLLDWEVIANSQINLGTFRETIQHLFIENQIDAKRFIDEVKKIPRFHYATTGLKLNNFLITGNYLPTEGPISKEDMTMRLQAIITNLDIPQPVAQRFIERIIPERPLD